MSGERFQVTFEANRASVPATARLRRLLKYALRSCGLRCVEAADVTSNGKATRETSTGAT